MFNCEVIKATRVRNIPGVVGSNSYEMLPIGHTFQTATLIQRTEINNGESVTGTWARLPDVDGEERWTAVVYRGEKFVNVSDATPPPDPPPAEFPPEIFLRIGTEERRYVLAG